MRRWRDFFPEILRSRPTLLLAEVQVGNLSSDVFPDRFFFPVSLAPFHMLSNLYTRTTLGNCYCANTRTAVCPKNEEVKQQS